MADLFQGRTMTEMFKLTSGGAAYTVTFDFQPDIVEVINLTQWASTADNIPVSTWFRDETTAAYAYQQVVVDSTSSTATFNYQIASSNGFTNADTSGGVTESTFAISSITQADPCVVTTSSAHGFQTGQLVRITDLGSDMPTPRGMDQIDGKRYAITVLSTTTFSLQDPISGEDIDSSSYTAYVSGGNVTLITHVQALNYPESSSYTANQFEFDPIEYKLTLGTGVMGTDGDKLIIKAIKMGNITDLGDVGA